MESHQPRLPTEVDDDLLPVLDLGLAVHWRWLRRLSLKRKVGWQVPDSFAEFGID